MTAEKPARTRMRKHTGREAEADVAPSEGKRHLVDFDPWAILSAGLMDVPEERTPTARERPKRK